MVHRHDLRVDLVSSHFESPRARESFLLRMQMTAPWAVRVEDEAPLALLVAARGTTYLRCPGGAVHTVAPGGAALLRGPYPVVLGDAPTGRERAVVRPGNRCETPGGTPLAQTWARGVRTWGDPTEPTHVLLSGVYAAVPHTSRWLLAALPEVLVVAGEHLPGGVPALLAAEVTRDDVAQSVVLDRLLDLCTVLVVRHWLRAAATAGALPPGPLAGLGDPVVGRALQLMHDEPAHGWTVASLAARAGVSRAWLARRFGEVVGRPPIAYLTDWRLALAADRLAETDDPIARIARDVGYGSPFALSTAFSRHHGVSPQQFRRGRVGGSDVWQGSGRPPAEPTAPRWSRF